MFWLRLVVLFALRVFQKKLVLLHARDIASSFFFQKKPHNLFFLPNTLSILSVNTQQLFLSLPKSKIV
ncbi:hypothetical protein Hanom_Chr17g01557661 [Helianthus anomalus]